MRFGRKGNDALASTCAIVSTHVNDTKITVSHRGVHELSNGLSSIKIAPSLRKLQAFKDWSLFDIEMMGKQWGTTGK